MRISDLSSGVCSSDLPLQAPEGEDLGRAPGFDDLALGIERVNRHVHLQRARSDTPGQDAAEEIVAVEQSDQELDRSRSEERRVGKECVRTCRSGWTPYH